MPDQNLVTMYILSLGIDVSRWFRPGHRLTPDELAEEYARLVLHAIAADATKPVARAKGAAGRTTAKKSATSAAATRTASTRRARNGANGS